MDGQGTYRRGRGLDGRAWSGWVGVVPDGWACFWQKTVDGLSRPV